jgi:hypothetical protein
VSRAATTRGCKHLHTKASNVEARALVTALTTEARKTRRKHGKLQVDQKDSHVSIAQSASEEARVGKDLAVPKRVMVRP